MTSRTHSVTLRAALGALVVSEHPLKVRPRTERELFEVLHVLRDAKAKLGADLELDRGALTELGRLDDASMTLEVQAGATLKSVEASLSSQALSLGALPPAAWSSTVADYLEGPYAGLRAIAGGRLEPICARLEGLFADGRHFVSSPGPRSAAGPDLRALFLGASGRLGLITRATLRAFAAAEAHGVLTASFEDARQTVAALTHVLAHGAVPSRVQLSLREARVVARIEFSGSRGNVERDRDLMQRSMPEVDASVLSAFSGGEGVPRETSWPRIEAALRRTRAIELHRLSLTSVVAIGEVEGLRLDQPTPWSMPGSEALLTALDAAHLLGGAV